eukprot:SAG31_NODE_31307_length_369_cov_1.377778_1_plen_29_part_10
MYLIVLNLARPKFKLNVVSRAAHTGTSTA